MKFFNHFRWYDCVFIGVILLINHSCSPGEKSIATFVSSVIISLIALMIHTIEND